MIDFKDLDTDPMATATGEAAPSTAADIRAKAHIANGGEAQFPCPACRGTGTFRSYTGRAVGNCFKCKGSGNITKGQAAAVKAKATREANYQQYLQDNQDLLRFLEGAAEWSQFAADLLRTVHEDRRQLSERQQAAAQSMMAKTAARHAAIAAEREAAKPAVDISAIDKLFETATENKIKRPVFRADGLTISKAPATGRNAGAMYVKGENGDYYGKLMHGKFHAVGSAPKDVGERLLAVAADPTAESIKYARKTGRCGCCGRELVDPVSILAGIGPVCAENWKLDMFREMGREEYAKLKAEEKNAS